jgi:hypothetical protein
MVVAPDWWRGWQVRMLAFAAGQHVRLGEASWICTLDQEVVRIIGTLM